MSVTISSLYVKNKEKYGLELIAGAKGLTSGITWALCIEKPGEGSAVYGNEFIVSTCKNKEGAGWLLNFIQCLINKQAAGLAIQSIKKEEVPQQVIRLCDDNQFPLFLVDEKSEIIGLNREACFLIMQEERNSVDIGSIFEKIIMNPADASAGQDELLKRGFRKNDNYSIIVFDLEFEQKQPDVFNIMFKHNIEEQLSKYTSRYGMFLYERMWVLITGGVEEKLLRQLVNLVQMQLKKYDTAQNIIGVSSMYCNMNTLAKNFRKTLLMVKMGKKRKSSPVFYDEEEGIDKILLSVDEEDVLKEYYIETLGNLMQYDKNNKTDYLQVLRIYLDNDASVQKTAETLFVHRNTVNYQLNRIQEIVGLNLHRLSDRFKLELAYRVGDLL